MVGGCETWGNLIGVRDDGMAPLCEVICAGLYVVVACGSHRWNPNVARLGSATFGEIGLIASVVLGV